MHEGSSYRSCLVVFSWFKLVNRAMILAQISAIDEGVSSRRAFAQQWYSLHTEPPHRPKDLMAPSHRDINLPIRANLASSATSTKRTPYTADW